MSLLIRLVLIAIVAVPIVSAREPQGPITLVIPFSAGGSNDTIGRFLGDRLSRLWSQPVVVENRPGAGSAIGSAFVARSAPDGRTLLFVSSSVSTNAATLTNLPFDPEKDLLPVGLVAMGQMVIVTGSRVPLPTLASLVQEARRRTIFYGTAGVGGTSHFAAELLNDMAGVKMVAVHYRGASNALIDMAGGRLDVYIGTVTSVMSSVAAKTARPIAIAGKERVKALPEVPTVAEAGFPGAETDLWWGVFAPAGTPAAVVDRINTGINTVMTTDESRALLARNGATAAPMGVGAFQALVSAEFQKWRDLAAKHHISPQ